jgi:DNA-binding XRE family transcriptional regulator
MSNPVKVVKVTNFQHARMRARLSQYALAERAGVSRQTIYMVEHDQQEPSVKLALRLAKILDTTVENIWG